MIRALQFFVSATLATALLVAGIAPAHATTPRSSSRHTAVRVDSSSTKKPVVHPLGLSMPKARKSPSSRYRSMRAVPASVDLSAWTVQPGDQGQVGSCTTWAIGYSMMGYYANRLGAPTDFAPMYLYSQIHVSNDVDGGGSSSRSAYNVLRSQGIDTQSDYTQGNYDWRTQPTAAQKANATPYLAGASTVLYQGYPYSNGWGTGARDAIEQQLADGHPVALGIPIYPSFDALNSRDWTLDESDTAGSTDRGGHMVLVIGYDESGVRIENSWGTSWGQGGYADLSWDFVEQESTEASTISGFAASSIPAPSVPSVPTGIAATTTKRTATVSWAPPIADGGSAITGYVATETWGYSGAVADSSQTLPASARSATFTGLSASTPYALTVRAVTATTRGSVRSVVATTAQATVPGAPRGLVLTPSADSTTIGVAWDAPDDDGGYGIWDYDVTSTDPSLKGGAAYDSRTGTVWGALPGHSYQVSVAAQNGVGVGTSATASITMPLTVPGAPNATMTSGSTTATISWTPSSNDGGTPLTGYRVTALLPDGTTTVRDLAADAASSSFTDLPVGSTTISVAARNALGLSAARGWAVQHAASSSSSGDGAGTGTGGAAPVTTTPVDLRMVSTGSAPTLVWNASDAGAGGSNWFVDAIPIDAPLAHSMQYMSVANGTSSFVFDGMTALSPGVQYRLTVRAPGGRTADLLWTVPAAATPAPSDSLPSGEPMPVDLSVTHQGAGARLSWNVVGGTGDGSGWTADAIPIDHPAAASFIGIRVAAGAHEVAFSKLTPGERYRFVVRTPGLRTMEVRWTAPAAAPAKNGPTKAKNPGRPAKVWLTGSGRSRVLHWTAPKAGAGVVRWSVGYRAAGRDKAAQLVRSARTWKVGGLHAGRRYTFHVRTLGAAGRSAESTVAVTVTAKH